MRQVGELYLDINTNRFDLERQVYGPCVAGGGVLKAMEAREAVENDNA